MSEQIKQPVKLIINGRESELLLEPRQTLLDALRNELGLTGTKRVCDVGDCGACTVLLNGRSVYSCLVLAVDAGNSTVETVEGLGHDDQLHPIQQAFIDSDGFQCGYCTAGQLVNLVALFRANPQPTDDQVKHAASGNLCRCAAYQNILRAADSLTDGRAYQTVVNPTKGLPIQSETWDFGHVFDVVGQAQPRLEGRQKVTGAAKYSSDIRPPGLLYARVLRSPVPHARVRAIDTSLAEAFPGVHAVLSSANCPSIAWYKSSFLFDKTVRFAGDEVAAVAAESEDLAEDALHRIVVDYEELPFVVDIDRATRSGAPPIWSSGNLAGEPDLYQRGDVDLAFREADIVIDHVFTTQAALHNALEPHGCTAEWDGEQLKLWSSTQSVFQVRKQVADALGLRQDQVRVIMEHMGGGFGAKQVAWKHDVIASLLAMRTGRPVHLALDREAENLAVGNRNPTRQSVRLAARRDGTLTAIDARIEQAIGAYMVGGEGSDVPGVYQTMYRCLNVRTEQILVHTNTGPAVAFRAPGFVEGAFALESAMDELAHELGIDPLELRRRSYAERDQVEDLPYSTDGLRACYEEASRAFGWTQRQRDRSDGSRRRGFGMAANVWSAGSGHPPAYAWVKLNQDGSADVITGTQDIGTGTRTGLAQIAAEELGISIADVSLRLGDTERGPYAPVSSGSSTQPSLGPAIRKAAGEARQNLLQAAAGVLGLDPESLEIEGGIVRSSHNDARQISVSEVCQRISPNMIQGFGARGPNPPDAAVRTFAVQFAEVEVDIDTGEVDIVRVVSTNDCGRIINPMLVDSQVIGGVNQGVGFALMEERVVDNKLGLVLNANLEEYKVPTMLDAPPTRHARLDLPDLLANSTGAKGIGEPPLIATAPAIANAVFDAVGVRIRDLPLSRWTLLNAFSQREQT